MLTTTTWRTGPLNTEFYVETFAPAVEAPRACIVFVHGYIEHVGRYHHMFPALTAHGIAVFAYDGRGFGKTALDEEHRSPSSAYGKTNLRDQLSDLDWAAGEARKQWPGAPMFIMGHSMGGAVVLSFCTRPNMAKQNAYWDGLSGVIISSPLLRQAKPAPKIMRWVGSVAAMVAPNARYPSEVSAKGISRDEVVGEKYLNDPYVKFFGTLRGIDDMLSGGDTLLSSGYRYFPKQLPVLLMHGTADTITSYDATQTFYNKVDAADKTFSSYEGGFHEVHNEPDGMKERWFEECAAWVTKHIPEKSAPATAAAVAVDGEAAKP